MGQNYPQRQQSTGFAANAQGAADKVAAGAKSAFVQAQQHGQNLWNKVTGLFGDDNEEEAQMGGKRRRKGKPSSRKGKPSSRKGKPSSRKGKPSSRKGIQSWLWLSRGGKRLSRRGGTTSRRGRTRSKCGCSGGRRTRRS
jgi:hypothetical protein